jgi:HPt (histidine-containing phosphotransfer) domain-containing protein
MLMEKETIRVDSDLSDLVPGFLARKRDDLRTILDAIGKEDYDVVTHLAHRIKGEGGSYGFDRMTELGRAMQEAAGKRDSATIERLSREMLQWLDRIDIVYEATDS